MTTPKEYLPGQLSLIEDDNAPTAPRRHHPKMQTDDEILRDLIIDAIHAHTFADVDDCSVSGVYGAADAIVVIVNKLRPVLS